MDLETPPFGSKSWENKGGFQGSGSEDAQNDPDLDHFLKRFPLSSAPNTPKFSACGGPKSGLHQICRSRQTEGGVSQVGGGFPRSISPDDEKIIFIHFF